MSTKSSRPALGGVFLDDRTKQAIGEEEDLKRKLAELGQAHGFHRVPIAHSVSDQHPLPEVPSQPVPEVGEGGSPESADLPRSQPTYPKEAEEWLEDDGSLDRSEVPVQVMLPAYIEKQLRHRISKGRMTKKYLVMQALAKDGYYIDPDDMKQDGRRSRRR